jgi:DnaJ-class molecular chaperone with C-terminal Zn finger domain
MDIQATINAKINSNGKFRNTTLILTSTVLKYNQRHFPLPLIHKVKCEKGLDYYHLSFMFLHKKYKIFFEREEDCNEWAKLLTLDLSVTKGELLDIKGKHLLERYLKTKDFQVVNVYQGHCYEFEVQSFCERRKEIKEKKPWNPSHVPLEEESVDLYSLEVEVPKAFSESSKTIVIPGNTSVSICDVCCGDRKILCTNCNGKNSWQCTCQRGYFLCNCIRGYRFCQTCKGEGNIECASCYGDKYYYNSGYRTQITCSRCFGSGRQSCFSCIGGNVVCEVCNGLGKIKCKKCKDGTVICDFCNEDGKIFCYSCKGEGGFLHYKEANISWFKTSTRKVEFSPDSFYNLKELVQRNNLEIVKKEIKEYDERMLSPFTNMIPTRDKILDLKFSVWKIKIIEIIYMYKNNQYRLYSFGKNYFLDSFKRPKITSSCVVC